MTNVEENLEEQETLEPFINTTLFDIDMEFSSNIRTVHEEVLILDGIGLLGSLGGSLGLFIGFSFFGYLAKIIDVSVDMITSRLFIKADSI